MCLEILPKLYVSRESEGGRGYSEVIGRVTGECEFSDQITNIFEGDDSPISSLCEPVRCLSETLIK